MDWCVHCGNDCGLRADYGMCTRCGQPHCDRHYYTPAYEQRQVPLLGLVQPDPGLHVRWALEAIGTGCVSCLSGWAREEEAKLDGLLQAAARLPNREALSSLSADWPLLFRGDRGHPSDPGAAAIEGYGTRLVAAVAEVLLSHGSNCEVAELSAEPKKSHKRSWEAILHVISRTPAVVLPAGADVEKIITRRRTQARPGRETAAASSYVVTSNGQIGEPDPYGGKSTYGKFYVLVQCDEPLPRTCHYTPGGTWDGVIHDSRFTLNSPGMLHCLPASLAYLTPLTWIYALIAMSCSLP